MEMKPDFFEAEVSQTWRKNGVCPERTIPILRTTKHNSKHSIAKVNYNLTVSDIHQGHEVRIYVSF